MVRPPVQLSALEAGKNADVQQNASTSVFPSLHLLKWRGTRPGAFNLERWRQGAGRLTSLRPDRQIIRTYATAALR